MRIAAVGDSVMWGQGLHQHQKFVYQTLSWLKQKGYDDANLSTNDFLAHSGAIVGEEWEIGERSELYKAGIHDRPLASEFPRKYPTVLDQLGQLSKNQGDQIDILIMNGFVNDIGAQQVSSDSLDGILKSIEDKLTLFSRLLEKSREVCPHALILYTGFYPALSSSSKVSGNINSSIFTASPVIAGFILGPIGILAAAIFRDSFAKQSINDVIEKFWNFHLKLLCTISIEIANYNRENRHPIIFVHPGFTPENSIYAAEEFIYSGNFQDPYINDDIRGKRAQLCKAIYKQDLIEVDTIDELIPIAINTNNPNGINAFTCVQAQMGHPNPKGSRKYSEVIKRTLNKQLNFSLKEHLNSIAPGVKSVKAAKGRLNLSTGPSLRELTNFSYINCVYSKIDLRSKPGSVFLIEPFSVHVTLQGLDSFSYKTIESSNAGVQRFGGEFTRDYYGEKELGLVSEVKVTIPDFILSLPYIELSCQVYINGSIAVYMDSNNPESFLLLG